jgi:hypothetical protein
MPMNTTEAQTLERNSWFKDRVRNCTSVYVNYLLNTDTADPLYEEKIQIASRISQTIDNVVITLVFTLSGDPEVNAAGPAIEDAQLQLIVEKTIQKYFPVVPSGQIFTNNMGQPIVQPRRM